MLHERKDKEDNMNNYFIKSVDCDVSNDIGPCCGCSVVTGIVNYSVDDNDMYFYNIEVDGMPTFYLASHELDYNSDCDELSDYCISSFEGIDLNSEEYNELMPNIYNAKGLNRELLRLLIYVTRCSYEELEIIINECNNKNLCDINVPSSDVEKDYLIDIKED
ncbi:MAG: hypothetical protein HUJ61_06025 [Bacilli bacterium]|nr:hypothetical protein [Bacilli bacterium]